MIKMLVFAISIIGLLDLSVAQFVQKGTCNPNIELVQDFKVSEFLGLWYVTRSFQNLIQNGDCSTMEFAEKSGNLTVHNRAVQNNFLDESTGSVSLQNGTAKLVVTITGSSEPLDLWILSSTNFSSNSLCYACKNIDANSSNVYIWQLSRTTIVADMVEGFMNQTLLSELGITIDSVPAVDHSPTACHVLPDIPAGQPVVLPGQCNQNISAVQQFNATAFTGVWHEIYTYASSNEIGTCRRAQYQLSGSSVEVINSEVVNQTLRIIRGNASISSSDESAQLQVTLEVAGISVSSPLWVLDTDYTSYAVSYTCTNLPNNQKRVNSWILSRSRQLTEAARDAVNAVIRSEMDLNSRFYVQTKQNDDDCFYFPEFVPNQPVVFPGQCDLNIKGMTNFNANRYLGLWHNIESYYATSQRGTCGNARYSLRGDLVNVFNTQVVNQELDSITGTAEVSSTDGSATLVVTFPGVSNTTNTANYVVLDSDYVSYAVVYSCSNINNDERRVTAFKLSRTKELNSSALVAIDRAISQIPVLDQRYFVKLNQTEEGCFYYPKPQPGVPVLFPGKCEDNVNVVQNFSLEQFGGTWFEIEAYPISEQQQRHCVNHNFTTSSNTSFSVVTSSVNDQFLEVLNSNGTFASPDGSARMTITLPSQNNQEVVPFWILDTDYSNYALAYGCVNKPDDYRLVYSWKLSRNKQLSESNSTSIDNIFSNVTVLENRYFEDINHSTEGCFFLPEIPKGEPIIIDGQCSSNISVVPNFNATAYLGNWRLIESYSSQFQSGTCNRANYALGPNTTVVVTNTQVVNQTLETAMGSATILGNGRLLVNFPGSNRPLEYLILDTDYSSYSLVYSCENISTSRRRIWSWKLSRSRDLTSNAIENINIIINSIDVLNNRYFEDLDQSDDGCFYYPTPNPNTPVIFPGQCDPNISVVNNFNASQYMNLWHNIASYPTLFQQGTCNNAFYTLQNGTVDVFNTQVINQTLDTINGVARLAGSDGSAKLIVNFPTTSGGLTESPYWVLDTDYASYALVYSCINLNDERRQVTAWTLSRTKQLTVNATAAIDRVSSTIPVLDNKYYISRNQSPESCFYYPEPKPGVVVEFPGQCTNIQAVQNFNMSLFQGLWHEIEAYPIEQNIGQCINHEYTPTSTNSTSIKTTYVISKELGVSNSTVTFNSPQDLSGSLTITIISGGQEIKIPFVIISTDYVNYALAYSCVNLPNDHQRVFSWKLSRTKSLKPDAVSAISNATANIVVLDNRYYENIYQTDDACFYLPTPVPGAPVEFVGQCDDKIDVVQNFSAADYIGHWLVVETYFQTDLGDSCNDVTYSLNSSSSVIDSYTTQVINQTLITTNGTVVSANNDGLANLILTISGSNFSLPYSVLDTDYKTFSLVYTCENLPNNRRRVASRKLSRTAQLPPAAIARINQVINRVDVLDSRYFQQVDRSDSDCFYFPTPGPNAPIFRGVCDENITVVQNYNASAYSGRWYDIQSYPSRFQTGTCNTVVGEPAIDTLIYKTQVLNEKLDEMWGVSRYQTSSNIAKFEVTFSNSTVYPYWILSTDYVSYSLVYSCVNLPDRRFQVNSWKLSRTKQLTPNATAAIDRVANSIPVLNNQYYINRDHTDQGCFYYPEPISGAKVIFPGQCDTTIQAHLNFNISAFSGIWHEIEAYPDENRQSGQCINHNFNLVTSNTLNLITSSVFNQNKDFTNSTATFTSNQDSSGKLTIRLPNGNTVPFWVLSTDYNDYALAYSCVNINETFRAVSSWKLSRNQQLSPAANSIINNVTENINVLKQKYYERISQTDDACFYLPTPVPGVPVEFVGQCDENIAVVPNFRVSNYTGPWLLIQSYPAPQQEGSCNDATYSLNSNGTAVDVYNTKVVNQELVTVNGVAVLASNDSSAKLLVTFPGTNNTASYWVLDTDYTSFALVYSCQNLQNNRRRVTSWKLSRTAELTPPANARINQVISRVDVLDNRYFQQVDRSDSDCFYFPTPGPNAPIFRGVCDENITVVQNYNASAYSGRWYDIQSYPSRFQIGTCNTVVGEPAIDTLIYKTQVLNEKLDEMWGVSRNQTSSNIAKFEVTFSNSTVYPYWILSTDYVSYSLVYSCVNLPDRRFQVNSWKLSRTKQLTPNATAAIDRVANSIPVLNNQYYINRDHTDQGCFYYPEPISGAKVIFPGQCDTTIQAHLNFNISAFSGIWHEIEAYPDENRQSGQCINHNFNVVTSNTLNLITSSVFNQNKDFTNSTATFTSNQDSSGKLTIRLPNGNTVPFWVLSTDYNDYALAYSCVNINETFRAVSSWKLSRNQQLSLAANSIINNVTENINVLKQKYYERISQTDDACFYLPTPVPGVPVEFVGQCDENIAVVPNFRVSNYMGPWLLIQSYPAPQQEGSCNDATYSLNSNGTAVDVYNTKVVNQELVTVNGVAVLASNDSSAKLLVTFPGTNNTASYWVLDTDYTSFALVYSCQNLQNNRRRVTSWKLSRTPKLTPAAIVRINQVVSRVNVLDNRYFENVDRTDSGCFYFPTPGRDPIVFPGRCDNNITVVQNFNATAYLGTWYDIESYPVRFQLGSCPTANYEPSNVGIDVYNTEVVAQRLSNITGSGVLSTIDGSAKLIVSFPISGTDGYTHTPYWVLATDYSNFALVYSCVQVDDERRRVSSWKLSRTKTLTPASTNRINSVISSVQVLDQKYYSKRGHTDEDCFFYPENNGGPVVQNGQCDNNLNIVNDFDVNLFAGPWYEISRFPSELQEGECVSKTFTVNNETLQLSKNIVYNEKLTTLVGSVTVPQNRRGILTVNLTDGAGATFATTYQVLDVVYNDSALLHNCRNLNSTHKQIYSWKLSRSQTGLSAAANERINQVVNTTSELFEDYYDTTDQTINSCFYYPVFEELPAFIELLGPCNTTDIRAQSNFNVTSYLGKWHEIASYPQAFQNGECARAQYSAGNNVVNVLNTQVVNRTLDARSATAVVASNDGSGLLEVTFPFGNVTNVVNYYVLETDYTSFSFVYSCQNLDNGNRRVTSWKLSRGKVLPSHAAPIIDNIIKNTQGLHQDYYKPTSQSDEDCFYIPEVNKNEAPLFRGQCENITGMQDFDVQKYLGWWHEIESYPTNSDVGNCVSSNIRVVDNQYEITDTNVFNNSAQVNTSTVAISADGRIRRTLSNGEVVDIWVLETDYETYSLLYSCENVNSESKRVWSAKHSKSRQLTTAAQQAMAPIIARTKTLEPQFYIPISQSDEDCFHYPEQIGMQIILPGQCDPNIEIEQNFAADKYSGTWYQIEKYPQRFENGTCIGARYTLNENTGVVNVLNWQVWNGTLDTIEGNATINSTDGSAKLIVNLPIRGGNDTEPAMVSMELYVLKTDYITYSLAYSCVNIDPFHRAVGAWKLSRTRTLTGEGNSEINAYMNTRQELYQPYFETVEQNNDCQEPNSSYLVKSSIFILLICSLLHLLY